MKRPWLRVDFSFFVLSCRFGREAVAVVGPVTGSQVHEAIGGLKASDEGFESLDNAPCSGDGGAEGEWQPRADVAVLEMWNAQPVAAGRRDGLKVGVDMLVSRPGFAHHRLCNHRVQFWPSRQDMEWGRVLRTHDGNGSRA